MAHRTITLPQEMSFAEGLQAMLDGKCLGIRPGRNTNYIEFYTPAWMRSTTEFMLRWNGSNNTNSADIRSNQYLETWYPVVIGHRTLGA
jgi:hypothetical protein